MKKNKPKFPLISVIVPNRPTEKNESLPSIKRQTYPNIEVINIIDKNLKGQAWARNQGIKKAKGEYIFCCDNDIELRPDCLMNLYKTLQEYKWAGWSFGRFSIDGIEYNKNKNDPPENKYCAQFIDYFHGVSTMSLIRAECKPMFDEKMRRLEDWDLWVRLERAGHESIFCDKMLFETKSRPGGVSCGNDLEKWRKFLYSKRPEKIADIIIPHHNRHDLLVKCLEKIDNKKFNITIECGGSFARNCNKGARGAETENLIFLNDDTLPDEYVLIKMATNPTDITGIAQNIPENGKFYGIKMDRLSMKRELATTPEKVFMPSGFCFKVKTKVWKKLGGFDEKYINGAEDIDFFLRAMEKKMSFGYLTEGFTHLLSQSDGRFDHAQKNDEIVDEKWKNKIKKLCGYSRKN